MKVLTRFRWLELTLFVLLCGATVASAQWKSPLSSDGSAAPVANTGEPVNDQANVIDDAVEAQLNQKLKAFKERTNPAVTIAVLTVRTTGGRDAFEYSLAVARGWKIGTDAEDNPSALLFVAVDDRKYQTQISRDLEDELPDGVAGQLQRQFLIPAFRAGNFGKGISDTIDAYIARIEEIQKNGPAPTATPKPKSSGSSALGNNLIRAACCLIVIIVILAIIFGRGKGGKGGGGRGGRGSSDFGDSALPWILGSILVNSGSSSGSSWDNSSSWGSGGDSSWDSGGGSSDWGGFGGGGDFGGGGSGGSW